MQQHPTRADCVRPSRLPTKDSGRGFGIRDERPWILCDLNTSGLQENWVGFDLKL
jgi:hypothetical protein